MEFLRSFVLLFLFSSQIAFGAKQIHGTISILNGEKHIILNGSGLLLKMTPSDREAAEGIKALKNGDYLEGTGSIVTYNHSIIIKTVEFVGLKKVLGSWVDSTNNLFQFVDFKNLNLYYSKNHKIQPNAYPIRYTYLVAPEKDSQFVILMRAKRKVHVGRLNLKSPSEMEITVEEKDQAPRVIRLSRPEE